MTATPTIELAQQLRGRGVKYRHRDNGFQGRIGGCQRLGVTEVAPVLPENVVDTTGAGDAFNSGFAVAIAEGT